MILFILCGLLCVGRAHSITAFPGDQDTVHLYPFVCAADGSDAKDTIGTSDLQNQGGVTYPQGSGIGFCNASSVSGNSRLFIGTSLPGSFGTLVFTVTFLDHAGNGGPPSFIDWSLFKNYHVLIYRDDTNHMCIYMADYPIGTCSTSTYSDGMEYHFAVTYDDSQNTVKLYESVNGLLFTRPFGHISNAGTTAFAMGGYNTDGNPGPSTLLSQVFIENRPWTDQEVQNYFNDFVATFLSFPLTKTTAYTAPISAVMDHHIGVDARGNPLFYSANDFVDAYTGEEGALVCAPATAPCAALGKQGKPLPQAGYKNTSDIVFKVNGGSTYTGGSSCFDLNHKSVLCNSWLFYDGHPGYDYPVDLVGTEDVYAPANGTAFIPDCDPVTRKADCSGSSTAVDGFNILTVDHGNGYSTWYLHMGDLHTVKKEPATIPGAPFQITVAHASMFQADHGVIYSATRNRLTRVPSNPSSGQYSVATTGVYTFASADSALGVLISYLYYDNNTDDYRVVTCPGQPPVALHRGDGQRIQVTTQCTIGKAGNKAVTKGNVAIALGPHLHFEVRKGLVKNPDGSYQCLLPTCVPVDPYGWTRTKTDPYPPQFGPNIRLWR